MSTSQKSYSYRQKILAGAAEVFELLCPVRERQWLAGWECTMVHSASGLAEKGCVFTTPGSGAEEPPTVWIISRHDKEAGVIQLVRFTSKNRTCILDLTVTPAAVEECHVEIRYTYTPLSARGERFLEALTEEEFMGAVTFWERSMNHWLVTGEQLKPDS